MPLAGGGLAPPAPESESEKGIGGGHLACSAKDVAIGLAGLFSQGFAQRSASRFFSVQPGRPLGPAACANSAGNRNRREASGAAVGRPGRIALSTRHDLTQLGR